MSAFHDLKLKALDGQELPLAPFKGQVVLVVNVASKCGLTPQYAALENLYQQYKAQGFSVLGLPCNQFAGQEPGTEQEIQEVLIQTAIYVGVPASLESFRIAEGVLKEMRGA